MAMETRGGVPQALGPIALTTTPTQVAMSAALGVSKQVRVQNLGANTVRVYFSAADAAAGSNYLSIPAFAAGHTVLIADIEATSIWLAAGTGTTTADVLFIGRRG